MNVEYDNYADRHNDLADDPEPTARGLERIRQTMQNFSNVSEALRVLGAAVLVASMSVFLLQGWNDGNDIRRYLMLLTQTGLLTLAGFALSHGLKETKGARLFFGLALISIPANFTILSALLYSVLQWDGALTSYPEYATWQIGSGMSTSLILIGAIVALTPITMFCNAIMARKSAITLSVHFLLLNILLLLPIRSSGSIGAIALFATLYALYVSGKLMHKDPALSTAEGKFALTTLFIPAGIILFRSLYFYQVDSLLIAMLSVAVFLTFRQISLFRGRKAGVALALEFLSLPIALIAAVSATDALELLLPRAYLPLVFSGVFALFAMDVVRRTDSIALAKISSGTVVLLTSFSFILNVMFYTTTLAALFCVVAGLILIFFGFGLRERAVLIAGCVTAAAGIFFGIESFVDAILSSSWIDLAIFGASSIAVGSVLDRHGATIKIKLGKWFTRVGEARYRSHRAMTSD